MAGINCCFKCPNRFVECHSVCDIYKQEKIAKEKRDADLRAAKNLDKACYDIYTNRRVETEKRIHRRTNSKRIIYKQF